MSTEEGGGRRQGAGSREGERKGERDRERAESNAYFISVFNDGFQDHSSPYQGFAIAQKRLNATLLIGALLAMVGGLSILMHRQNVL